ncbi:aryl-alcohol dehydrogenase-like predicted oxidoreductase [Kineosphaera limosa]|uniref:Putative aldo/keto reductase n=1 Tax=Kineosphaera limosa NBRC 100340 TaxID=1184609 RepID=K6XCH1_9MICO|nr:aldo/keto reductase [Kineosphaera limosa]NYD99131.1 aryl-alcohol dehydrogenase-like predicted oxidoreductase [Kineosphaera limosa]GAB96509.1 putative aldo/keto reductase [Kineosphaera limosa NBRC 100340]
MSNLIRLGTSGLRVSPVALGCMSFGAPPAGGTGWMIGEDDADAFFRTALESGITLWDTANSYGHGASEEIVGRAIRRLTRREEIVLTTKVFFPMGSGPGESGLSRRAIFEQVEASLRRLDTDWIDLYQIHRFDPHTPVEETMQALHDLVASGKVRYLGASSMHAWQFAKLQHAARLHGWTPFVSMQNQYSLLQREEEREMFGLLADQGVGSLPWSPLARGRVARPYGTTTTRSEQDANGKRFFGDGDPEIINAVERIARERGVPMAQVALAWVMRHPVVTAPIIGATRLEHITDAAAAVAIELTDDEAAALEAGYTPRDPTGY